MLILVGEVREKIKSEILRRLRESRSYVSGEKLASALGVSRAALNKHIFQLKKLGYEIDSAPHRGYWLKAVPDVLFSFEIKSLLTTRIIGREVYYFPEISTTQDYCRYLAEKGELEGALVIAEVQSRGRGRLGREWKSSKGGLWFSLLLRPEAFSVENLGFLPLIAALGMVKALEKETKVVAGIKWPNDILVRERKVGGVLTEIQSELERVQSVQLGIGLNVNNEPPLEVIYPATSIWKETGKKHRRADILKSFLSFFESYYLSFKKGKTRGLLKKVEGKLAFKGQKVVLRTYESLNKVRIIGVETSGRLLVDKEGEILKLSSGEIEAP